MVLPVNMHDARHTNNTPANLSDIIRVPQIYVSSASGKRQFYADAAACADLATGLLRQRHNHVG